MILSPRFLPIRKHRGTIVASRVAVVLCLLACVGWLIHPIAHYSQQQHHDCIMCGAGEKTQLAKPIDIARTLELAPVIILSEFTPDAPNVTFGHRTPYAPRGPPAG